jgi:hypothetical protein
MEKVPKNRSRSRPKLARSGLLWLSPGFSRLSLSSSDAFKQIVVAELPVRRKLVGSKHPGAGVLIFASRTRPSGGGDGSMILKTATQAPRPIAQSTCAQCSDQ